VRSPRISKVKCRWSSGNRRRGKKVDESHGTSGWKRIVNLRDAHATRRGKMGTRVQLLHRGHIVPLHISHVRRCASELPFKTSSRHPIHLSAPFHSLSTWNSLVNQNRRGPRSRGSATARRHEASAIKDESTERRGEGKGESARAGSSKAISPSLRHTSGETQIQNRFFNRRSAQRARV